MKIIFIKIWNWKYRNHAICFIVGFLIATIIWLSIGSTDYKLAEKLLSEEKAKTEKLQKELTPLLTIKKSHDSLFKEFDKIKNGTKIERIVIYKKGNDEINKISNSTSSERQRLITEWAERNGGNINMAE